MFDKISYLSISGANFAESKKLPIFRYLPDPKKPDNVSNAVISLIYGRNGEGKSTIANAIKMLSGDPVSTSLEADFFDLEDNKIILSDKEKQSIYVFNEDFVNKFVRNDQDGLNSIVILEKKPELAEQINEARTRLAEAEEKLTKCQDKTKEYEDEKNEKSPAFYQKRMLAALRKKGGWAEQDSKLRGNKTNTAVGSTKYEDFANIKPDKTQSELYIEYDKLTREYENAKGGSEKITTSVPSVEEKYTLFPLTHGNKLLSLITENPVLSDREEYLISLAKNDLKNRIEFLNSGSNKYCPYCLQDLTSEYKTSLIAKIQRTLEHEVKKHQIQLEELMREEWDTSALSPFVELKSYKNALEAANALNEMIKSNNKVLQNKINSTHIKSESDLRDVANASKDLTKELLQLEKERTEYNKIIDDHKPVIEKIKSIISQLAYYDIKDDYQSYKKFKTESDQAQTDLDLAKSEYDSANEALEEMLVEERGTKIAIDLINNGLKYIFYDENRLSIVEVDNKYVVYSRGKPVKPNNISVGERNVIGLCYFFVKILQDKENEDAYKTETLLVIDDPISSFDFQNKVGVLSFMNYKIGQFVQGNKSTRVLILTHDFQTMLDLNKLSTYSKSRKMCELNAGKLNPFKKDQFEYSELISMVYKYSIGEGSEYQIVIGNVMRQVVEAFGQFFFKDKIGDLLQDNAVLERTDMSNNQKEYFHSLMSRLVLHGGSHREEQVQSMDIEFLSAISEAEKRRTAQDILCFIYLVNPLHLQRHFEKAGWIQAENRIKSWCNSIDNGSLPRDN